MRLGLRLQRRQQRSVTVDGVVGGTADYGQPRPDVAYPGIALRGIAPGQFAFSEDCGKSLAGHATCTLKARVTPSFKGAKIAYLNLSGWGGSASITNSRRRLARLRSDLK